MNSKKDWAGLPVAKKERRGSASLARHKRPKRNTVGRPKSGSLPIDSQGSIIEAALDLFAAKSSQIVSTKDIANAVGFNTALIYYYFDSKDELFRRTILLAVERATAVFRAIPTDAVDDFALRWVNCHHENFEIVRRLAKLSLDHAVVDGSDKTVEQAIAGFRRGIESLLAVGLKRSHGVGHAGDVKEIVAFTMMFLDGVYFRSIVTPGFDADPDFADLRAFLVGRLASATGRSKT